LDRPTHRRRTWTWAITLGITGALLAMGGPQSSLSTAAGSSTAAAGSVVLWAYGNQGSSSSTGIHNGTYEARNTYFGWHVVLTQTNLSATTFQLELVRTMGFTVYASFCNPDCSRPLANANLTVRAWEQSVGFANFTTNGSVDLNGSVVPALALVNDHASTSGNVTETLSGTIHRILGMPSSASGYVSVHDAATVSVTLSPALGLIPTHLAPGESWSSASRFVASGSWQGGYVALRTGFNGTPVDNSQSFAGSAAGSGNVTLLGEYAGNVQLDDGSMTSVVHLALTGPFDDREGILLVPAGADLFGGPAHDWSGLQASQETADTTALDLTLHGLNHFGLLASSTGYSGAASNPNQPGTGPSVTPAGSPSGVQLQGQPESVAQAQWSSNCLVGGGCAAVPPTVRGIGGGLFVVGALAVAILAAALLVAARRRPVKPSKARPPRRLPPGAAGSPGPAVGPSAGGAASRSEPDDVADPLGRLW
jgi:hypothetical protein